jgi:hypothetical protein
MTKAINIDKQIAVIGALTGGSSIRSFDHMTGIRCNPEKSFRPVTVPRVLPGVIAGRCRKGIHRPGVWS